MLHDYLIAKTKGKALDENIILYKDYRITILKDRLFRIEKSLDNNFCDLPSTAVWYRDLPLVSYKKEIKDGSLFINTDKVTLVINDKIENSYVIIDNKIISLNNDDNLLGTATGLDGCLGNVNTEYAKTPTPIVMENGVCSKTGVAIIDDSNTKLFAENGLIIERKHEKDIYVFAYGNEYQEAVKAFYEITGKAPLIPRFAFGIWWSRFHDYSDEEYLNLMDEFFKHNIPLTVATIDMDWHPYREIVRQYKIIEHGRNKKEYGFDPDAPSWYCGWTGYSFNKELFPHPKQFNDKLHKLGLVTAYNLHPNTICWYEKQYEPMAKALGMDPKEGLKIDLDFDNPNFINNYFDIMHRPLEKMGCDLWWLDDSRFMISHYHYLDSINRDMPLVLTRYTGIGSHRYPLGFSGDSVISWESLKFLPYFTSTASNIGFTWWSHDIGGFMSGHKDDELYIRYVELGVFLPILRLHCQSNEVYTKEPWTYVNGIGELASEHLRYRTRLIPYLYSGAYRTYEDGYALIEPLYYYYPDDKRSYDYKNEYMFNGQLLVCPITEKSKNGYSKIKIFLPKGNWTDIFTGNEYNGNKELYVIRSLSHIPVLAKDGSFVVTNDETIITNKLDNPKNIKVDVFNGNGNYVLTEDKDNKIIRTIFDSELIKNVQHVSIMVIDNDNKYPKNRKIKLSFRNITDGEVFANSKVSINHNNNLEVIIKNVDPNLLYEIEVRFNKETKLEKLKKMTKFNLQRMEGDNKVRAKLYDDLMATTSISKYKKIVKESQIKSIYKKRLLEGI